MSDKHIQLCREAMEHPFSSDPKHHFPCIDAHPPELLLALWSVYTVLRKEHGECFCDICCAAEGVYEEMTND